MRKLTLSHVIKPPRTSSERCPKRISLAQSSHRLGHTQPGDILTLRTMSTGIIAVSFTRICGYSGKSRQCCTAIKGSRKNNLQTAGSGGSDQCSIPNSHPKGEAAATSTSDEN